MFGIFRRNAQKGGEQAWGRLEFSPDVTAQLHADGAVFLHSGRGMLFSCNLTGAKIWQGLQAGRAFPRVAAEVADEYGVAASVVLEDGRQFLRELAEAGILRHGGGYEAAG